MEGTRSKRALRAIVQRPSQGFTPHTHSAALNHFLFVSDSEDEDDIDSEDEQVILSPEQTAAQLSQLDVVLQMYSRLHELLEQRDTSMEAQRVAESNAHSRRRRTVVDQTGNEWLYTGLPAVSLPSLVPVPLPGPSNGLLNIPADGSSLPMEKEQALSKVALLDAALAELGARSTALPSTKSSSASAVQQLTAISKTLPAELSKSLWDAAPEDGTARESFCSDLLDPSWQPSLSKRAASWLSQHQMIPSELGSILRPGDKFKTTAHGE